MSKVSSLPVAVVTLVSTAETPVNSSHMTKRKKPITKATKEEVYLYFAHTKYTLNPLVCLRAVTPDASRLVLKSMISVETKYVSS